MQLVLTVYYVSVFLAEGDIHAHSQQDVVKPQSSSSSVRDIDDEMEQASTTALERSHSDGSWICVYAVGNELFLQAVSHRRHV